MPDQSGHPATAKRPVRQPGRPPVLNQDGKVRIAGPAATGHRAGGLICAIEAILKIVEDPDTPRHLPPARRSESAARPGRDGVPGDRPFPDPAGRILMAPKPPRTRKYVTGRIG